jgi:hypothetical protein
VRSRTSDISTAAGALVLFASLSSGCGSVCSGPGCEDFYAGGRLSGLSLGAALATPTVLDVWEDADRQYAGVPAQGPDWSVALAPGEVLIGQPDVDQVLRLPVVDGVEEVAGEEAVWSDLRDGSFGADLAVVVTDAEAGAYDLWVGAPDLRGGAGQVFLYRDAHLDQVDGAEADLMIGGLTAMDGLGTRVVVCADLTGDGRPEVAITIPRFSAPERPPEQIPVVEDLAGGVLLVRSEIAGDLTGTVEPWDVGPLWWGDDTGEGAGTAVACDRDLDGDDQADVAIGAPWWGGGRGRVYLVAGAPALPASGPLGIARPETGEEVAWRVIADPDDAGGWFGHAITTYDWPLEAPQLVVGAPGAAGGDGKVHVFDASALTDATAPEPVASFLAGIGRTGDHVGRTLAVGDVDGDGLQDLLVGAPDYRDDDAPNAFDLGSIFVWTGATWPAWELEVDVTAAPFQVAGSQPFQRTGRRIVTGDADGDGADELWVPTRSAGTRPRER